MCSILPESFRWLLTKNRLDDAERVIEKISDFNDLPFPREEFNKVVDNSNKTDAKTEDVGKSYSIIDIFRSSILRKRSIILACVWYVVFGWLSLSMYTRKNAQVATNLQQNC